MARNLPSLYRSQDTVCTAVLFPQALTMWTCLLLLTLATSVFDVLSSETLNYLQNQTQSETECGTCSSQYSDEAAKIIQSVYSSIKENDCALANPAQYPANYDPDEGEEFDFIVVGAGSAGCVVASRLSEVQGWKILLLEAGGNPTKTSEVPALFADLQDTEIDWQYKSNPDEDNCLGLNGNRCNLPRGKVLGGSSTINYMQYVRGNSKDYDDWEAAGNTGWGYEDVLPYFKKLEDMRDKIVQKMPDFNTYHNIGGPQKAEAWPNKEVGPVAEAMAEGMQELGYPPNYDVNGPCQIGYAELQGTLKDGKRCSTAKSYLTPITNRENLKVSKESLVCNVLIDSTKTAYGVEFITNQGVVKTVHANKEVVLSAGAFNSPQLLMLSGIGPKEQLRKFNISMVQDLPVGKNLQDHPSMLGLVLSLDFNKTTQSSEESMFDFLQRYDSLYSSVGMGSYVSMINTETGPNGYPDMDILTYDFARNTTTVLSKRLDSYNIKDENKRDYLDINRGSYTIIFVNSLLTPLSRGYVELQSTDPRCHPKITIGFLTHPKDIDRQLKTYDFLYQLAATTGLKKRNAKIHEIKIPNCMKHAFASKAYRICALKHLTTTTYHPSGTCKMGPADSPDSVVDPQLRVKGVHRLRVVDAAIMPNIPRANLNIPVIMIGEKGSDIIKKHWLPVIS